MSDQVVLAYLFYVDVRDLKNLLKHNELYHYKACKLPTWTSKRGWAMVGSPLKYLVTSEDVTCHTNHSLAAFTTS